MNKVLLIFICFIGCYQRESIKIVPLKNIKSEKNNIIDNFKKEKEDSIYSALKVESLIDSLRLNIEFRGIHNLTDLKFPLCNQPKNYKYFQSNISSIVYFKIFSDEIKKIEQSNPSTSNKRDDKFKYLISMVEKDDHLQFLFTTEGKYCPLVYLVTTSKSSLKKIDDIEVFRSFTDADEYDIVNSIFDEGFDNVTITKIKNNLKDYYKIDTIINKYQISKRGVIEKI